ncbi:hypothetical protein [Pontibacter sp. BAB1700]|uniref:hypothetical protein n=1 Tax=Pontibacter sp. BAB1700 TaxID=1144253 RepID=UPI00026BD660|nr:hypothetical protein [Pontibacter sp. BAB1700]EJF08508.1 hypothetical protein O71_20422 [Pontibacter sp. BAB1700]
MNFTPSVVINLCDIYDGKLTSSLREEVSYTTKDSPHIAQVDAITNKGDGLWYDHQYTNIGRKENVNKLNEYIDFVTTLTNKIANIRAYVNADTDKNINIYILYPLYLTEADNIYDFLLESLEEVCKKNLVQQFNVFTLGLSSGFSEITTHKIDLLKAVSRQNLERINQMRSLCFPHKLLLLDTIGITGAAVGFSCESLAKSIAELVRIHASAEYLVTGALSNNFINSFGVGVIGVDRHLLFSYYRLRIIEEFLKKEVWQINKKAKARLDSLSDAYISKQINNIQNLREIDYDLIDLKETLVEKTQSISEKVYIIESILSQKEIGSLRLLDIYDPLIKRIKHYIPKEEYATFEEVRNAKFELIESENEYNETLNSNDKEIVEHNEEAFKANQQQYHALKSNFHKLIKSLKKPHLRKRIHKTYISNNEQVAVKQKKPCWLLRLFKKNTNSVSEQFSSNEDFQNTSFESFNSSTSQFDQINKLSENLRFFFEELTQLEQKLDAWKHEAITSKEGLNFERPLFIRLLYSKKTLDRYFKEELTHFSLNNLCVFRTLTDTLLDEEQNQSDVPSNIALKSIKEIVEDEITKRLDFINRFNIYHYFQNNSQFRYLTQGFELQKEITKVYNASNPFIHCTEIYKNYDRYGHPASVQSKLSNMYFAPNYKNDEDVSEFKSIVRKTISSNSPNHSVYLEEQFKISFLRFPYDLELEHLVEWYASPEDMPKSFEEYVELHNANTNSTHDGQGSDPLSNFDEQLSEKADNAGTDEPIEDNDAIEDNIDAFEESSTNIDKT